MKRIALALFLIWATPAAAQTPPTDWRTLVDAAELDRIENWERHFAEAVRRADRPDMRFIYGIDLAGLADLARTTEFRWPATPVRRFVARTPGWAYGPPEDDVLFPSSSGERSETRGPRKEAARDARSNRARN